MLDRPRARNISQIFPEVRLGPIGPEAFSGSYIASVMHRIEREGRGCAELKDLEAARIQPDLPIFP